MTSTPGHGTATTVSPPAQRLAIMTSTPEHGAATMTTTAAQHPAVMTSTHNTVEQRRLPHKV